MQRVIGVRFKRCGKIYDFEINGLVVDEGTQIVVESSFGLTIGNAATCIRHIEDSGKPLKKVIRQASKEDLKQRAENNEIEEDAWIFCLERIAARELPMKLIYTEVTLDRKRIVFYFTADGRIDFRELVKDLASRFKTRIEMRQIGVRDEAKIIGGLGICGREICCRTFLSNFEPISIRMAKRQDLVLNPGKLSGLCGRLMCCLGYECDEVCDADIFGFTRGGESLDPNQEYVILEDKGSEFSVTNLDPLNLDVVKAEEGKKPETDYKKIDSFLEKEDKYWGKDDSKSSHGDVYRGGGRQKRHEKFKKTSRDSQSRQNNTGETKAEHSVKPRHRDHSSKTFVNSDRNTQRQTEHKPYVPTEHKRDSRQDSPPEQRKHGEKRHSGYKPKKYNRFNKKRYETDSDKKTAGDREQSHDHANTRQHHTNQKSSSQTNDREYKRKWKPKKNKDHKSQ